MKRFFAGVGAALVTLLLTAGMPLVNSVTTVASLTVLQNTPTLAAASGIVQRVTDGVAGAPPMYFAAGTGTCASAGMTNDGASCVNENSGNHWLGLFPATGILVDEFGPAGNGSTDDTVHVQAAINAASVLPQPKVLFSPKTYFIGTATSGDFLQMNASSVRLIGTGEYATTLLFGSGTNNWVHVNPAGTGQLSANGIEDMQLAGPASGTSGGFAVYDNFTTGFQMRRVLITNAWGGVRNFRVNDPNFDYLNINTLGTNSQGFTFEAAADGSNRSDFLTAHDVVINAGYKGDTCWYINGFANTINVTDSNGLQCGYGLLIANTAASASYFPNFGSFHNFQIDGAQNVACAVNAGRNMYFTNSSCDNDYGATGQGSADTVAFQVLADNPGSVTSDIRFTGGSFGLSKIQGAVIQGQDVTIAATAIRAPCQATSACPAVELEPSATNVHFSAVNFCGTFGTGGTASVGLRRDATVGSVSVVGSDFSGCTNEPFFDISLLNGFSASGNVDQNGLTLPDSHGFAVDNEAPTLTSCGTSPSFGAGSNDLSGEIITGTGGPTSCTLTFNGGATNGNGIGSIRGITFQNTANPTATITTVTSVSKTSATVNFSAGLSGGGIFYHVDQ